MPRKVSILMLPALALAGCGGSRSTATTTVPTAVTVPTAAQVSKCVIAGGGQKWNQEPLKPKGFPGHLESSVTVGPKFAHITLYIARRPVFDQRLEKGFDGIGEYQATVLYAGRGLLLLDWHIDKKDEKLARECVRA